MDAIDVYLPSLPYEYKTNGYVALRNCLDPRVVGNMGVDFESNSLSLFAAENNMTRTDYLSVLNKWPHWNIATSAIMESLVGLLRHQVAHVLGSSVAWPVGAVIFRKYNPSAEEMNRAAEGTCRGDELPGSSPTHPHQDISYARFEGSQMFRATSWVPLLLRNGDTLAFAKGSHRAGIHAVEDFLRTDSNNSAKAASTSMIAPPVCLDIIDVSLGDCLIFDARTWHRSTTMARKDGEDSLRLAIGIQWLTPGGLDGAAPGVYARWPDSDVPKKINVEELRATGAFGIDTAGWFLKKALVTLETARLQGTRVCHRSSSSIVAAATDADTGIGPGTPGTVAAPTSSYSALPSATSTGQHTQTTAVQCHPLLTPASDLLTANDTQYTTTETTDTQREFSSFSTTQLAKYYCSSDNQEAIQLLSSFGCNVTEAQQALKKFVLFRQAALLHYGEAQGTHIFGPLHEYVIKPILGI